MVSQNRLMYCSTTTIQHYLSVAHKNCIERIAFIIVSEGGKNPGFNNEEALNLDKVETFLAQQQKGRNRNATVDMAFGVKDGGKKEFVLCEYKLRKKGKGLQDYNISNKIKYSKDLLGGTPPIYKCCLIVPPDSKSSAASYVRRYSTNRQEIKVFDLKGFVVEYF